MLSTPFCELMGIEVPLLQAAIWPATSPELVAAVGEAGAIGSLGAVFTPADRLVEQIAQVRALTDRPFVVNHVVPGIDEDAFAATLDARPAAVSFALGDPGELVARVHEAGAKVVHQVHTLDQALAVAHRGIDVLIAQGSEAGGQGLAAGVGTMVLVPQIADALGPVPVLAAGGVADGRGLAAALALGAAGANVGTRFLASAEASATDEWKDAIVGARPEDCVRFEAWSAIMPPSPGYGVVPRVIRTPFVDEWNARAAEAREQADELRAQIMATVRERRPALTPFTGQTAGLVGEVLPAGEIVRRMAADAHNALRRAGGG
ncbi:MAG TPA: nitronate monooxygenase [Solirubrobacteraceae bacterium]|nr:nitronate monooxygenase [Solirubrobacteraceae bacterium]